MQVQHNTEHTKTGLSRLLEQYKKSTAFKNLVKIYLDEVQVLEDAGIELALAFLLDNAVGDQLDILGAIVGEARQGREDPIYRIWIKVRIKVNRSFGKPTDIIDIVQL